MRSTSSALGHCLPSRHHEQRERPCHCVTGTKTKGLGAKADFQSQIHKSQQIPTYSLFQWPSGLVIHEPATLQVSPLSDICLRQMPLVPCITSPQRVWFQPQQRWTIPCPFRLRLPQGGCFLSQDLPQHLRSSQPGSRVGHLQPMGKGMQWRDAPASSVDGPLWGTGCSLLRASCLQQQ